ncbi:MAG: PilX N-terminal domain-containing pilus assembly protein [Sedimenticola sp.]
MRCISMQSLCRDESGAVLISGLLMLTVMTVLGVSRIQSAQLETRMAGNFGHRIVAFEGAEAAVLAAESFLSGGSVSLDAFDDDGADGLYNDDINQLWRSVDWGLESSGRYRAVYLPAMNASYVIQHYGSFETMGLNISGYGGDVGDTRRELFLITAWGVGPGGTGQVFIQATYEVSM